MATDTAVIRPPLTRDEVGTLLGRTMGLVAATAGFFAVGVYLGRNLPYESTWVFFITSLLLLVGLNIAARRSAGAGIAVLFAFGAVMGLAVAPVVVHYAARESEAVWAASGATALFVAGFGATGYATRRDLSGLARGLFWALVALIAFGVIAIFVQIPNSALIYSIVGLVIFAGLTAYDFQRLRQTKDIRTAPLLAASIFLDILNVFLLLLSPFGGGNE